MTTSGSTPQPAPISRASWQTRWNPPGLAALTYGGGKYVQTLNRLLTRLPNQTVPASAGDDAPLAPLANLNMEEHRDWSVALLHAWAAVSEVLSFYHERILNEGYIRTATEYRSILELTRMIGYELQPGVAASAHLALTVLVGKDEPPRQVTLPARVAVQSVPAPGQLPQIFETGQEFVARSDLNALKPAYDVPGPWLPVIRLGEPAARLVGSATGLQPGMRILIIGDGAPASASPRWLVATLATVQPDLQRGTTVVTWDHEMGIDWSSGPLRHPQLFVFRQQAALWGYTQGAIYCALDRQPPWAPVTIGLPHVPVHALVSSPAGTLLAGTTKGLFRSRNRGENWQPVSAGFGQKDILALTTTQAGQLFAGSNDGSIYLSQDDGLNWRATSGSEVVVIPPSGLAKLLPHPNPPLPKTVVRTLDSLSSGRASYLAAGTDSGVFLSADQGQTWQAANRNLPKTDAQTGLTSVVAWVLAVDRRGKQNQLYAGTDVGVFQIKSALNRWRVVIASFILALCVALFISQAGSLNGLRIEQPAQAIPVLLACFAAVAVALAVLTAGSLLVQSLAQRAENCIGLPVHALTVAQNGRLFAGTKKGVYRLNSQSENEDPLWQRIRRRIFKHAIGDLANGWKLVNTGLTSVDIRALQVDDEGFIVAGTLDGALFRSSDQGATWEAFNEAFRAAKTLNAIEALLVTKEGYFAAGLPPDNPIEKHWPSFQIKQGQIDLDKVYPNLPSDSWVTLSQNQSPSVACYQAQLVTVTDNLDAARPSQFTRIEVRPEADLADFDRTTTVVLMQREPFKLYADTPVAGDEVLIDQEVNGLEADRRLIVSGKRMRARLVAPADGHPLKSEDGLQAIDLKPGDRFQVLSVKDGVQSLTRRWQFKNKDDFRGLVDLPLDAITLEPAADDDETVAEVVFVQGATAHERQTTIKLQSPLNNVYDRSTVTVYGNIVETTHGQTVENEVLGASEGMQINQRFRLKQQPLTFVPAPEAPGARSTLSIQINGIAWHEVPYLYKKDRSSRVYMVRRDSKGNTFIIFGDGESGAGVPEGTDQITGTYRLGLGQAGNVPASSLTLLQTAVPGIKSVTNPVAAAGGSDPEAIDQAQARAPLYLRALQRLVSLTDYEDFARTFPGVAKAQGRVFRLGRETRMHLTIAGAAGGEIPKDSQLYQALTTAIQTRRALPVPSFQVDSFEPVYFNVEAKLLINPDYVSRRPAILAGAQQALRDGFSFARREFGQWVASSEVIALLQELEGVVAVELTSCYVHGADPKPNVALEAQPARLDGNRLHPAQLLMINPTPDTGIQLHWEIAP